jgi:hypothetical protein
MILLLTVEISLASVIGEHLLICSPDLAFASEYGSVA